MKIALPWYPREDRQFGDEYNITFVNKSNNFDNLIDFLTCYPDIRFNILIDISEYEFDFQKIKILNTINPNIHIILNNLTCQKQKILKKNNIKFYLSPEYAVSNFRMLECIASLGVTDIYIQDDLCYNLSKVRKAADKLNIQIRLILNQIASSIPNKGENVRSPWFIPETVDELDKYIDIAEFENNSWVRIETLYKIWFKDKQWRENLRYINPQLNIDIWNQCMIPDFTKYKMNCGYRCAYGSVCKKCNQFTEMAQNLYNKKIEYSIPKGEQNV